MRNSSFWKAIFPILVVIVLLTTFLAYFLPFIALIFGIIAISFVIWYERKKNKQCSLQMDDYIDDLTERIEQANFYVLRESPMAIAIFDSKGILRWNNRICAEWFVLEHERLTIENIFPTLTMEKIQASSKDLQFKLEEKTYNVAHKCISVGSEKKEEVTLIYITDITLHTKMQARFDSSRLAIAYVQFDNYSNVLKGLNDSQRENIKAEVNKLVGSWVDEIKGVYRQYTDEMYFVVMHRHALETVIEQKFDILDRLREIKAGNKLPVTFSFGVSCDGDDVIDIGQKAQLSLDMALGRGGDQAAVSFDGKVLFFGGVTMAQEKNTRVGARSAAYVLKEIMSNADVIFISGHINEDFDSIGAAVGVAKMAMLLNKEVYIITSGDSLSLTKFNELVEDYEEYKKILITDQAAVKLMKTENLLILVDHHRPMLCAAPKLLEKINNKIIIDHHRRAEDYIDNTLFTYQEPSASSTCELVTELLTYFADNVDFNRLEATMMYVGIVIDSKNFAVQTGARTFEAAATLRLAGADPTMVRQLFREDIELVKSRALLFTNMEILPHGIGISSAELSADGNSSVAVAQVADIMLNTEGVKCSFVLGQMGDEVVVSARSIGIINVQLIMEELGGGGHQTVAGVKIKNAVISDLKEQIIELVKKQLPMEEKENDASESDTTAR